MLKAEEVKRRVDIVDLADKLGLVQPGGKGNYKSPHHDDKNPSLQIFEDGGWKDYSSGEGGSLIDLVMYVKKMDFIAALEEIHDLYGWDKETHKDTRTPQQKSLAENIADRSLKDPEPVIDYLVGRGIKKEVIEQGIKRKTIGWNVYTRKKRKPGEMFYAGPAAAFIVRTQNPGKVVAVDMRYQDPELNGGLKTTCQGERFGHPWVLDWHRLMAAKTVYVVESPINVLSIETCNMPYTAALATRGVGNIKNIDWRFLQGKRVVDAFDNDKPDDDGKRPGLEARWALYDELTALNIACHQVDWSSWNDPYYNDVNNILQAEDPFKLQTYLKKIEPWIIPGQPGDYDDEAGYIKPRVFLPPHDYGQYWRYRAKEDFTTIISKKTDENGKEKISSSDLCGFRAASISRINIQSATATMSGEEDPQPLTRFAVTVQIPRFGPKLQRKVFEDERLHNVDHWAKFGPVFARSQFLRMISIMERAADLGARDAVNFVGLAWRKGKPVVNEGPDCYFNEPEKQCPYHNLTFPSGSIADARAVVKAYQATFENNAASQLLVWSLGGHLKAYIGTWPHAILQASKGAGKSTLIKRLERSIAFTMFSGQSLQTEFRLLTSISHTTHPVGWEELSARRQDVIDKAVSMLQESYQFGVTRRGSDMTEYLQCAPVLLAGEDVPVKSLTGKLVRMNISGKGQGVQIPNNLARFPLRQWLSYLVDQGQDAVLELMQKSRDYLIQHCAGDHSDNGARRMVENYAGVLTTWKLLCNFSRSKTNQGNFVSDLVTSMNQHISETSADREPWVWIIDTILNEITSQKFAYPFKFLVYKHEGLQHECLLIRPKHIMAHISSSLSLRETWNGLPVKTDRVLKQQLIASGVVFKERVDTSINRHKISHMLALSIDKLAEFNLHPIMPRDLPDEDARNIDDGQKKGLFDG